MFTSKSNPELQGIDQKRLSSLPGLPIGGGQAPSRTVEVLLNKNGQDVKCLEKCLNSM